MSHSGSAHSGNGPPTGDHGRNHYQQYGSGSYHSGSQDHSNRQQHARSPGVEQQYYASRQSHQGDQNDQRRTHSGKYSDDYRKSHSSHSEKERHGSRHSSHRGSDSRSAHQSQHQQQQQVEQRNYAPATGQMRSGHLELDSLYSGDSGPVQVNSMNAPNNSTVQCGCENIDCPFCNLMLSVQMGAK